MRASKQLLATAKEDPSDAEIVSHRLMIRAGLVRRVAAGLYTWLPMGLRVLHKIEQIVREEMDRAGALEVLMPGVQPRELWEESGRWDQFGPELLRLKDRHERDFCLGPTHEEIITDVARREIRSYKQLPMNLYQIQTKFRDEIRPRFGVMRSREFMMKDAYSFDIDQAGLDHSYQTMREAYERTFSRTGLDFRIVAADSGSIGGNRSEEFHVLADSGEDAIVFNDAGTYAANIEMASLAPLDRARPEPKAAMEKVHTPGVATIEDLKNALDLAPRDCLKTLIVEGDEGHTVALLIRGDHVLNAIKASKIDGVAAPLTMASETAVRQATGANPGSVGPVGIALRIIADHSVGAMADFACGANDDGYHLRGVNFGRDLPEPDYADLRNVVKGDPSPDGNGTVSIARGIEVGHIFQLGTRYSETMNTVCLDESGRSVTLQMGCYGIGVSRIAAAAIEQNHDERGIIWPTPIAPYQVAILPMNMQKSERVRATAEQFYEQLGAAGIEVLLDDRGQRPGVMFADCELIGIPHRVVIGDRSLDRDEVEYKGRRDDDSQMWPLDSAVAKLREIISDELGARA